MVDFLIFVLRKAVRMRKAAVIGLAGCVGSAAVIGWISRFLLRLVVRIQVPLSAAWFGGEDADPILLREETDTFPPDSGSPDTGLTFFVTASHQIGLDTRSMTRRPVYNWGQEGGGRARASLEPHWSTLN